MHARTSCRYDEIVWEARFSNIFERYADAHDLMVDIARIHSIEPAPLDRSVTIRADETAPEPV